MRQDDHEQPRVPEKDDASPKEDDDEGQPL
jgi:hypothetical protein